MDFRRIFGLAIVAIGLFALLHNFEIMEVNSPFIISLAMLIVGGLSLRLYFKKERALWWLIISLIALFWGSGILMYELNIISFHFRNQFCLFGIGLSFLVVYFQNTKNWWALIPGGSILVLFLVDLLDEIFYLERGLASFLLILGIGLIFFYLYLIRNENNRLQWAIYPAIVIVLFSLLQLYFSTRTTIIHIGIAIVLILIGLFIIFRSSDGSSSKSRAESLPEPETEKTAIASIPDDEKSDIEDAGDKKKSK